MILYKKKNHSLITKLQTIHDYASIPDWKRELTLLAKSLKLNTKVLEQFQEE